MQSNATKDLSISDKCRAWVDAYPDVFQRWKAFGDPFQKAAAATIEAGIRGEI
jgi:hypothetical protein